MDYIIGSGCCGCGSSNDDSFLQFSCDGLIDNQGNLVMGLENVIFPMHSITVFSRNLDSNSSIKVGGKPRFLKSNKMLRLFSDNSSNILLFLKIRVENYISKNREHRFRLVIDIIPNKQYNLFTERDYSDHFHALGLNSLDEAPYRPVFKDIPIFSHDIILTDNCDGSPIEFLTSFIYDGISYKIRSTFVPNEATYTIRDKYNSTREVRIMSPHMMPSGVESLVTEDISPKVLFNPLNDNLYQDGIEHTYATIGSPYSKEYIEETAFNVSNSNIDTHVLNIHNTAVRLEVVELNTK